MSGPWKRLKNYPCDIRESGLSKCTLGMRWVGDGHGHRLILDFLGDARLRFQDTWDAGTSSHIATSALLSGTSVRTPQSFIFQVGGSLVDG